MARLLAEMGHPVSHMKVAQLLHALRSSLQGNAKTKEGNWHPGRDAQFRDIQRQSEAFLGRGWPVISVDIKKEELVGNYANSGQEWQPEGQPVPVDLHDLADPDLAKAVPHGVYDRQHNLGWLTVGCSHDTARFAVESIRRWWREMGDPLYPQAEEVLICADRGGSNGYRLRLWKVELQRWANESGRDATVCHYPPGTSKQMSVPQRLPTPRREDVLDKRSRPHEDGLCYPARAGVAGARPCRDGDGRPAGAESGRKRSVEPRSRTRVATAPAAFLQLGQVWGRQRPLRAIQSGALPSERDAA